MGQSSRVLQVDFRDELAAEVYSFTKGNTLLDVCQATTFANIIIYLLENKLEGLVVRHVEAVVTQMPLRLSCLQQRLTAESLRVTYNIDQRNR